MPVRRAAAAFCVLFAVQTAAAEERRITLAASPDLAASGFLKYLLPRFSLKTGVRIATIGLTEASAADVLLGPQTALGTGRAVFEADGLLYLCRVSEGEAGAPRGDDARRFRDWLASDVGRRTIEAFAPGGDRRYAAVAGREAEAAPPSFSGDRTHGARLARLHCGRCHVIGAANRMGGLGSTPSFRMLRTLEDWELRFRGFYLLNPHPSFTQVAGVTEPFDDARPPPIVPMRITLEELDAILAFAAAVRPADLGAPIRNQ